MSLNIPLQRFDRPLVQQIFNTYSPDFKISNSSTLRKQFFDKTYVSVIAVIEERIGSKLILSSVDETTDIKGRYIANFIMGNIDEN